MLLEIFNKLKENSHLIIAETLQINGGSVRFCATQGAAYNLKKLFDTVCSDLKFNEVRHSAGRDFKYVNNDVIIAFKAIEENLNAYTITRGFTKEELETLKALQAC